jgi:Fe-S-cluster containining protein
MISPPDCLTCGACCASPFVGEGYIRLNVAEEERLGRKGLPVLEVVPDPEDRIVLLGTKRNSQGVCVCVALAGKVGRQVACSIYGERPELCRQFEAGSPECHQARRAAGVEPNTESSLFLSRDLRTMEGK